MLTNTLNTNEVKNSAGTEVEFSRLSSNERQTEFSMVGELPNAEHRLKISHQESGSGFKQRRRSVVRVDKTVAGTDESPVTVSAYAVLDIPIGNIASYDEAKNVLAELMSFLATTGAGTTVLFDCSGNGAAALVAGSL
jgi:hypothetical protein